jgi:HSP20 family protein
VPQDGEPQPPRRPYLHDELRRSASRLAPRIICAGASARELLGATQAVFGRWRHRPPFVVAKEETMNIRSMLPWSRERQTSIATRANDNNSVAALQRDLTRVFDDFWNGFEQTFGVPSGFLGTRTPSIDVSETEKEFEVGVELPGLDEKDIDVRVSDDVLMISGEKRSERDEKRKNYHLSERVYGSFYRAIPLPSGVDADNIQARFSKGVLTVILPKAPDALERTRKIEVKTS